MVLPSNAVLVVYPGNALRPISQRQDDEASRMRSCISVVYTHDAAYSDRVTLLEMRIDSAFF